MVQQNDYILSAKLLRKFIASGQQIYFFRSVHLLLSVSKFNVLGQKMNELILMRTFQNNWDTVKSYPHKVQRIRRLIIGKGLVHDDGKSLLAPTPHKINFFSRYRNREEFYNQMSDCCHFNSVHL